MEKGHKSGEVDGSKGPPVTTGWKEIVRKYQQPSKRKSAWQLANTLIPYALLWVAMFHAVKVSWWLVGPLANKSVTRRMVALNVGLPWRGDNSRSRNELGIRYRPLAESMNDFFQQLVETGQLRR